MAGSVFITCVRSEEDIAATRLLVDSLQSFGGELRGCPFWVFLSDPHAAKGRGLAGLKVEIMPLTIPAALRNYPFAGKVLACAAAEALLTPEVRSLIWLDPDCLILQPPLLFDLGEGFDAALRPVHVRNVGIRSSAPPDLYWSGIYRAVGIPPSQRTVESFMDRELLRAYFNSHGFSLNPAARLCGRWSELFERLVRDAAFQSTACRQELRRVFLFQAVLSALVSSSLDESRTRLLPPEYNYPYHLHSHLTADRRAAVLNDLVSLVREDRSLCPREIADIQIREPLRSWLAARFPPSG